MELDGGQLTIDGDIKSHGFLHLDINSGEALITGSIINNSEWDNITIVSGSLTIDGDITNNWGDTFTMYGGTLTVGGTIKNGAGTVGGFSIAGGAVAQFGGLSQFSCINVGSTSTLEIGAAGGAAAGALTIDQGVTVAGSSGSPNNTYWFQAPSIVDNGVIDVTGGSLSLNGKLTGSGAVYIGTDAIVTITSLDKASANTIDFAHQNGALTLDSGALKASQAPLTISNFGLTDVIDVQGTVTGASFSNGVLTLTNGSDIVDKLTLDGDYSGDSFSATPLGKGYTRIDANALAAPAGTGLGDVLQWDSSRGGSWDNPVNWVKPANWTGPYVAPGSTDAAIIDQPNHTQIITGVGDSASLTIYGGAALQGQFITNALVLEEGSSSSIGGSLTVNGSVTGSDHCSTTVDGGRLTVGGNITNGVDDNLTVSGGGTATITGNIVNSSSYTPSVSGGAATITGSITGSGGLFSVSGGALTVGGSVANGNINVSGGGKTQLGGLSEGDATVDANSTLEIGATGGAATGSLTINSGVTVTGVYFQAPTIVDNGVIDVTGGEPLTLDGKLTGSGAVDIESGASVTIASLGATAANTVAFTGAGGALTLGSGALSASQAPLTISGLDLTDVIDVQGAVTGASFSNGFLTLTDGASTVDKLNINGNVTGGVFAVKPIDGGYTQIALDTLASVTSVVATPSSGLEQISSIVRMAVTFNKAVTVTGKPKLSLNNGGSAAYQGASSDGKTLTFAYTVGANAASTPSLGVTGLSMAGAAITDLKGLAANVSGAIQTFAGLTIGGVTPLITRVSKSSASSDVRPGQTVTVTLAFSKSVIVKGAPTIALSDGGVATYLSGSGTSALTFAYKVASGQNSTDLQTTGITLPAGASITDSAGHAANLAGAKTDLALQIDSASPAISSLSSTPGGDLNAGWNVTISAAMSEPIVVTGAPTLSLNDGGTAIFDKAKSTQTMLVFDYTVAAGQNAGALKVTKMNVPVGASIQDLAGNAVAAMLPASASLGLKIDTAAPTVTGVTTTPSSGAVTTGNTLAITLHMSEAVTVTGTPALLLDLGGQATYDAQHSTATALQFDYLATKTLGTRSLCISGVELPSAGAIEDAAGNTAELSGAAANLGVKVNAISTGVANVTIAGTQDAEIFGVAKQKMIFAPRAEGTLELDAAQSFAGKIVGLTTSDTLDLANLVYGPSMTVNYSGTSAGGTLTIGNGVQIDMIGLLGDYTTSAFTLSSDSHGGVNVVEAPKNSTTPLLVNPHA